MISSLLTALGVAALSIQTPSNIQPQEPKRAYYDSSAVAEYGTTQGTFYNYSSYTLEAVEAQTSGNVPTMPTDDSGTYKVYSSFDGTNYGIRCNGIPSKTALDIYVDGVFYTNTLVDQFGTYYISFEESPTGYIWAFDHKEPTMSETIAEVVGDATTAAGAVLGSGISGAIALFYNKGITGLGIIALILTGVSLVWFAFSLVLRLWRRR